MHKQYISCSIITYIRSTSEHIILGKLTHEKYEHIYDGGKQVEKHELEMHNIFLYYDLPMNIGKKRSAKLYFRI